MVVAQEIDGTCSACHSICNFIFIPYFMAGRAGKVWEELHTVEQVEAQDPAVRQLANAVKSVNILKYEAGLCKSLFWNL